MLPFMFGIVAGRGVGETAFCGEFCVCTSGQPPETQPSHVVEIGVGDGTGAMILPSGPMLLAHGEGVDTGAAFT